MKINRKNNNAQDGEEIKENHWFYNISPKNTVVRHIGMEGPRIRAAATFVWQNARRGSHLHLLGPPATTAPVIPGHVFSVEMIKHSINMFLTFVLTGYAETPSQQ